MKFIRLDESKLFCDSPATFGKLLFMGYDSDGFKRDENGQPTTELINRRYNLFSERQGEIIRVAIPPEAGEKKFAMEEEVTLVNCQVRNIVDASGYRTSGTNFIIADDIVKSGQAGKIEPPKPGAAPNPMNK